MLYKFWIIFAILSFCIVILDKKYCMLRDISNAPGHQPYSWSRVQLAWWTIIVLSSFISILIGYGVAPTLNSSTVILLGISAATTATAKVIDLSDADKLNVKRHQDDFGKNFFLDILSDDKGVSVTRFQTVVFNAVFGAWFIHAVLNNLISCNCTKYLTDAKEIADCAIHPLNYIMPTISDNNLILLGLSSTTYAALKLTENKTNSTKNAKSDDAESAKELPDTVPDEANFTNTPAQG
jgi:hypothetical protein